MPRSWQWHLLLALLLACASAAAATPSQQIANAVSLAAPRLVSELEPPDVRKPANDSRVSGDDRLSELLHWARDHQLSGCAQSERLSPCADCFLVVGVKISALRGFSERQAIRETWADALALQRHRTRVVFLGCEPDYAALNTTEAHVETLRAAVALEKRWFGDLLTDELTHCVDSYYRLVDKTLAFFQWVTRNHDDAAYVMVTDDDVYVRIDKLTAMLRADATPLTRYYAGQVWASQYRRRIEPRRDPDEKNYLPFDRYAIRDLPPFAIGPHYVVSADLARFLAKNRDDLRGVGTLEDVSVAFWLLSLLQVRPRHLSVFNHLRFVPCHNALVSYANLSPTAMRLIHANIVQAQNLCRGFSFSAWNKEPPSRDLTKSTFTGADRVERALVMDWDLQWEPTARRAQIEVTITAGDESADALYQPTLVPYVGFCRFLLNRTASLMPTTVIPSDFCYDHRTQLTSVVLKAVAETPPLAQFFYASLNNLQQSEQGVAIFVRLTPLAALTVRTLVECLMAAMYPDAHVSVVDEDEHALAFGDMEPDFSVSLASEPLPSPTSAFIRIVIATDAAPLPQTELDKPALWLSSTESAPSARHIYLPHASLTFGLRANNSPVDLLSPHEGKVEDAREFMGSECQQLRLVAASAAQVFLTSLRDVDPSAKIHKFCQETDANPNATQSMFPLDDSVTLYRKFKFAMVFDDRRSDSGHVSDRLVTAFLAGSVPVYYGNVAAVRRVFNARAFVACGDFDSVRACAQRVVGLDRHPTEYEAMRRQPPVANATALVETFSWHPDVIERLARPSGLPIMADRLKAMIEDWAIE